MTALMLGTYGTIAEMKLIEGIFMSSKVLHQKYQLWQNPDRMEQIDLSTDITSNAAESDVFYIKMDDDIVFLPKDFSQRLYTKALKEKNKYTWWSPLVVDNALCTWLLKYHGHIRIANNVTAQAGCWLGWRSPSFAQALHEFFRAVATKNLAAFQVSDFEVSLSRFSINCIAFFGEFVSGITEAEFCPLGADDEEWISAVLPSNTNKPGRIVGDIVVSHFSYFTQERALLRSDVLRKYYALAKLEMDPRQNTMPREPFKARLKRQLINRLLIGDERPDIALRSEEKHLVDGP